MTVTIVAPNAHLIRSDLDLPAHAAGQWIAVDAAGVLIAVGRTRAAVEAAVGA